MITIIIIKKEEKWNWNKNTQYRPQTLSLLTNENDNNNIYEHWSCGKCKHLNLKQRGLCDVLWFFP